MGTVMWGPEIAAAYDATVAERFRPEDLDPTVDRLAELAGDGRALELAVGTGRVALPLSERGVPVSGIELSPSMVEQLKKKPGSERIDVTIGDMTSTRVPGSFSLVYLVFNTIQNVTSQEEQVAVFANAAAHLAPGGHFVIEVNVPQPEQLATGERGWVYEMTDAHIGIDTYEGPVTQISRSHHWWQIDGRQVHHSAPYRYLWPAEMDLMARAAGLTLETRSAGWQAEPFIDHSKNQVAVYTKP